MLSTLRTAAVLCLLLACGPAAAQEPDRPHALGAGAWAVLYQVEDLPRFTFVDGMLSLKYHLSQAAALRFGLGGNARQNDAPDYLSGGFKVQVLYLRYLQPEREVKFYLGAGPEGGYALSRSDVAPAVTRRDAQWTLGVAGRLGTEWFATKHVSLFAEYGNLLGTEHRAHREGGLDERTSRGFFYRSLVMLGVAAYL